MFHIWSLLCQRAIVDRKTGLTSVIDILENINLDASGPQVLPRFLFLTSWARDADLDQETRLNLRLSVQRPDMEVPKLMRELSVAVAAGNERTHVQMEINGMRAPLEGRYLFVVSRMTPEGMEDVVVRLPLRVSFVQPRAEAAPQ